MIYVFRSRPILIFCTRSYIALMSFPQLTLTIYGLMLLVQVLKQFYRTHTYANFVFVTDNMYNSFLFSPIPEFYPKLTPHPLPFDCQDSVRSREWTRISILHIIISHLTLFQILSWVSVNKIHQL